jgi:magnesium-transporting ATPase (P-type)
MVEIVEGMEVPADGLIIAGSDLTVDESAMTGETDPVKKNELQKCIEEKDAMVAQGSKNTAGAHDVSSPIIISGTRVLTGSGVMLVIVVGDSSCIGKIRLSLSSVEPECTPL